MYTLYATTECHHMYDIILKYIWPNSTLFTKPTAFIKLWHTAGLAGSINCHPTGVKQPSDLHGQSISGHVVEVCGRV